MKCLPLLFALLLFVLCRPGNAKGDTTRDKLAYYSHVDTIFKSSAPILRRFSLMLRKENQLQRQLFFHHITQKQYAARTAKSSDWLNIIPSVRLAVHPFEAIKPVPPAMAQANSQLAFFAESMNKGLTELQVWVRSKRKNDLGVADLDLEMAFSSYFVGAKMIRSQWQSIEKQRAVAARRALE
ncbi:hypothetical protein IAD21_03082 [Abditibacteriota bacterium]|nr:hypothetical protein IAD21_03082 [Abditibacteriota bacterium]